MGDVATARHLIERHPDWLNAVDAFDLDPLGLNIAPCVYGGEGWVV